MTENEKNIVFTDIFRLIDNVNNILFDETEEKQIISYLNSHNEECLLSEISDWLDQRFLYLELNNEYLHPVLNQFVCILEKFLLTQGLSLRSIAHNSQNLFIYLMRIETLEGAKNAIQCLVKRTFDYIEESRKAKINIIVEGIKEYIKNSYYEDISLESVSRRVFLSKFHLSRVFKRETGQTFNEYLIQVRITMAKKMLAETNLKVKDVALKVGYENDRSFAKIFKEVAGMTPGQYREQNKKKDLFNS